MPLLSVILLRVWVTLCCLQCDGRAMQPSRASGSSQWKTCKITPCEYLNISASSHVTKRRSSTWAIFTHPFLYSGPRWPSHVTLIFRKLWEDSCTKPGTHPHEEKALNLVPFLFFFFKQFIISSTPEFAESTPSSFLQVPQNKIIVQLVMHLTRVEVKDSCFPRVQNVIFCFSVVRKHWPFHHPNPPPCFKHTAVCN